jgi:hypothetical protein
LLGNNGVGYLFTRKKFGWDAPDFAFFITLVSAASVCGIKSMFLLFHVKVDFTLIIFIKGTLIVLPILSGYFKVRDGVLGVVSLLAHTGSNLTIAFATSPLMVYLCK